jgi:hypothetical protein
MNPDYLRAASPLLMAIGLLCLGLRVFTTKTPFVIAQRCWILAFLPLITGDALTPKTTGGMSVALVGQMVFIVTLWWLFRGYAACGVTNASFREALTASLRKLNLSYEETPKGLRAPELGVDLRTQVKEKWGVGFLNGPPWSFGGVMRKIVKGMNEYYRSGAVPATNMNRFFIFCLVAAVFFLILSPLLLWADETAAYFSYFLHSYSPSLLLGLSAILFVVIGL